jgi:CheY-like chemotaxis protein
MVDDAKALRFLVEKALGAFDCEVREATNGYNALFAMEQTMPDLILLDVSMPIMTGLEMLTLMRSHPTLKAVPVIMLTSRADHLILPQLAALGISGMLVKPFNDTTLIEKIQTVIKLKPARPAKAKKT